MRRKATVALGISVICGTVLGYTTLDSPSSTEARGAATAALDTPAVDVVCCGSLFGCGVYAGSCPSGTSPRPCPCTLPY
jgi:hypothetical protein